MAMFHELRGQQRELLDQLDELEEAISELSDLLDGAGEEDEGHERLAWLHRQQAGVRVMLGETERALLAFSESEVWEE
ncbi:MAG: hypothetical protein H6975_00585 [Gammaproteobacteria bacterium]|nr:hypothetical protein [Gammaproteobacteria bacterium]